MRPTSGRSLAAGRGLPVIRVVDGRRGRRSWPGRRLLGLSTDRWPPSTTRRSWRGPAGSRPRVRCSEGLRTIVVEREAPAGRPARRRGSRLPWFPWCPVTSCSRAFSRRGGSARRFSSPGRPRGSTLPRARCTSTAATSEGRRSSCLRRLVAPSADRGLRPAGREGHLYGAARSEASTPRSGRPYRRRGQLGRAGGALLLHVRAQRDDPLPCRQADKSMSRYLIDQLATRRTSA